MAVPTIDRALRKVLLGFQMQQQVPCQHCKKALATIHVMDMSGGQKREKHFCERCAGEEGIKVTVQAHVPLNELLTSFVLQQSGAQQLAELKCPECGTTFAEFRNVGLLGCPHDYDAMEKALLPLLQRAHEGATQHKGKVPRGSHGADSERTRELSRLRRELDSAVKNEDFERAARLRDAVKTLERA